MIGCLRTHVHKQPIIALYFEFENELRGQDRYSFGPVFDSDIW